MNPPQSTPQRPRIFISFASGDAEIAHRAVEALEHTGIRCWIADRDIQIATSYPAAITAAIKDSGALLLLLTPAANQSRHVLREVELAFNARRPILPVSIADTRPAPDLQYFLSTSQWLDAGPTLDDAEMARISAVLRSVLDSAAGGSSASIDISVNPWTRWPLGAIALLAVMIVAAVAAWWLFSSRDTEPSPQTAKRETASSAPATPVRATPGPVPGATKLNPRDGQNYVWIPPGTFVMGCSPGDPACAEDEKPAHAVEIPRGFWLARTEVTTAQFNSAASRVPAVPPAGRADDLPVTGVDWSEAKAYCARVDGRLPTEAEWEYAARAGEPSPRYGVLPVVAWFVDNSDERPHPVGMKTPNAFGVHDMLGNVSEWVLDRYYNAYDETSDPLSPDQPLTGNASAVARGGSWTSEASGVRLSRRLEVPPDAKEPHIGFRCAVEGL